MKNTDKAGKGEDNPQMLKDANVTTKDMEKGIRQMENYFRDVLLPRLQEGFNKKKL